MKIISHAEKSSKKHTSFLFKKNKSRESRKRAKISFFKPSSSSSLKEEEEGCASLFVIARKL